MKKIKWTIMTLAIVLSVGAAFAFTPRFNPVEYYWNGTVYMQVPVGDYGDGYICMGNTAINCTYIKSGSNYILYRTGQYKAVVLKDNAREKNIK